MSDRILCYDTRTRIIFETTEDELKEQIEKVNNILLNRIDSFADGQEMLQLLYKTYETKS